MLLSKTASAAMWSRHATRGPPDGRPGGRRTTVSMSIAAGGDGTIGAVASGLLGTDVALGVLPLGSIMNIPRMLGVPRDLEAAATALATGERRRIDVGEAPGRRSTRRPRWAAAMFREANQFEKGDWLSILRTIWVALRNRPARMHVDLDGAQRVRTGPDGGHGARPVHGGGQDRAPEARVDDGKFEVRVFRGFSKPELIRHLAAIAFGRYATRRTSPRTGRQKCGSPATTAALSR